MNLIEQSAQTTGMCFTPIENSEIVMGSRIEEMVAMSEDPTISQKISNACTTARKSHLILEELEGASAAIQ